MRTGTGKILPCLAVIAGLYITTTSRAEAVCAAGTMDVRTFYHSSTVPFPPVGGLIANRPTYLAPRVPNIAVKVALVWTAADGNARSLFRFDHPQGAPQLAALMCNNNADIAAYMGANGIAQRVGPGASNDNRDLTVPYCAAAAGGAHPQRIYNAHDDVLNIAEVIDCNVGATFGGAALIMALNIGPDPAAAGWLTHTPVPAVTTMGNFRFRYNPAAALGPGAFQQVAFAPPSESADETIDLSLNMTKMERFELAVTMLADGFRMLREIEGGVPPSQGYLTARPARGPVWFPELP